MKKAIIVVYHGSHREELNDTTSTKLTTQITNQFKDFKVFEVFTSLIVHHRLEKQRFKFLDCITFLETEHYDKVYVLTTNLIHGVEFDVIEQQLKESNLEYEITNALLQDEISLNKVSNILTKNNNGIHLFVGHGSKRKNNIQYLNLENKFKELNVDNHYICVIDGSPQYYEIENKLDKNNKLFIYPLMFIAGYHAKKDVYALAKTLKDEYINVEYINESLGMKQEIRDVYIDNLRRIIEAGE